jgi:L-seryl-tRNA(Ser) seleniumtransferase
MKPRSRREIPAVGRILDALGKYDLPGKGKLPRPMIIDLIRSELSKMRSSRKIPDDRSAVEQVHDSLELLGASRLQPVINGTGVVIHTNFGRVPIAAEAVRAVAEIGSAYSNLEYDLATGERGHRGAYTEKALAVLSGAEAATVVNNCAAALVLIVHHFTAKNGTVRRQSGRQGQVAQPKNEIIISRGELVQIGGGFRIAEIIEATGAVLREVGATNKTTLEDYRRAIGSRSAMILKVHHSNFFMSGFVESPPAGGIAALAKSKRIPFVEDLGSGAVVSTEQFGIAEHETTPRESLKAGSDLVCFSGDKLLGGPQAGIIAGKKRLIAALKREPLFRALRCDKLCFAALNATIDLHLNQRSAEIPATTILQSSLDGLHHRAEAITGCLRDLPLQITTCRSPGKVGGGALPKSTMASVTIDIVPQNCSVLELAARLRSAVPPIIGYIEKNRFKLDLRTVLPHQDDKIVEALRAACAK